MTDIDLTPTIAADSDQLCAADLPEPRLFEVLDVFTTGDQKKPIGIRLRGHDHPWLPSKTARRVLVAIWGPKGRDYVGRWLRLYCDPTVIYGGNAVGGVRINGASHIDGPQEGSLPFSRGKYKPWKVQPIQPPPREARQPTTEERIAKAESMLSDLAPLRLQALKDQGNMTPPEYLRALQDLYRAVSSQGEE
jgi:hypothetical protein